MSNNDVLCGIDWAQDEWFKKEHAHKVTYDFAYWWRAYYGKPDQYEDVHEYFVRASFALAGWHEVCEKIIESTIRREHE